MTAIGKLLLLLTLLLLGGYVNYRAATRMEHYGRRQQRLAKLKASATVDDYAFMKKILSGSAAVAQTADAAPSTSLVVKNGAVIGEGHDRSKQLIDPSAHGEMEAVKAACQYTGTTTLKGSVLYTSIKPCPMCLALLYLAEVERIVYYAPSDTTQWKTASLAYRRIYDALNQDYAYRPIPELVLQPSDIEKFAGDGWRKR
ncbi:nucleoside deaminase [Chryseolinea lacunae]|uniref:CMP/dCMP-type deaminase domain-containing protein n=1 Tax=Chryseolinea lacunae TaxID=2801331 RepID=A0ABS1KMI9_9BACT|nr:nucleoside deaminase [Chryseolinea lacunae]MBL0740703.1 hypothetical protein [Chryseolinea lacunae]